jgi:hypothetical protein
VFIYCLARRPVVQPPGSEDPIAAVFDLSDRAAQMEPTIRRMYRYTATVVVIYLVIMVVLLLVALAHDLFLALLAVGAIAVGVVALSLLRETDRFIRSFAQRHRVIRLFRDAEPTPKVPEGRTPIERLARYLATSSPTIEQLLREDPQALRYRVALAAGRRTVAFDLVLGRPGGSLYRALGVGDAGYTLLARVGPDAPTLYDLESFATDVAAVAPYLPGLPVRAILLRTHPVPLIEPAYDYAVGHPIAVRRGWTHGRCTLEVISENPDGTYDLVPHVLGLP